MGSINFSGSIGVPGSSSLLGAYNVVMAGDHTLTPVEFSNKLLIVTSSVTFTTTHNLIGPSNPGQEFVIQNNTTGGQSIQIIASTGNGVTIVSQATASVIFDGTNYILSNGQGTSNASLVVYNPGAPGDWSPAPDVVSIALDQLAARGGVTLPTLPGTDGYYELRVHNSDGYWVTATSATTPSLVFRPNGTASGNVYTTEASLATATQSFNGAPYEIFFDLSLVSGSYTFEANNAYLDLAPGGIWTDNGLQYDLTFANNTVLTNVPAEIKGKLYIIISQTTDVCSPTAQTVTKFSEYCTINCSNAAFLNGGVVSTNYVIVKDSATLYNAGTFACHGCSVTVYDGGYLSANAIDSSSDLSVFSLGASIDPTLFANIPLEGSPDLPLNLTDTAGTATGIIPASYGIGSIIVDGNTGQIYVSNGSAWVAGGGGSVDASAVTYEPQTPGNWFSPPTEVANALDGLSNMINVTPGMVLIGYNDDNTAVNNAVAIGSVGNSANGEYCVTIGGANTTGTEQADVAIGYLNSTNSTNASIGGGVAIGRINSSSTDADVTLGSACSANGSSYGSFAAGYLCQTSGPGGVAIGASSQAGEAAVALGLGCIASGYGFAAGNNCNAYGSGGVAIGDTCSTGVGVAIGSNCQIDNENSVAIGANCIAYSEGDIAIGDSANANGGGAVSIGYASSAEEQGAVAIGNQVNAGDTGGIAIGNVATGATGIAIGNAASAYGDSVNGIQAIAIGSAVSADHAIAIGNTITTTNAAQFATGYGADPQLPGERTHGVGFYQSGYPVQTLRDVPLIANSSGDATGEATFTCIDGSSFYLDYFVNTNYPITAISAEIRITVLELDTPASQTYVKTVNLLTTSGGSTWAITGSSTLQQFGSSSMSSWTINIETDGSNLLITVLPNGTIRCTATARVTFEVLRQPV